MKFNDLEFKPHQLANKLNVGHALFGMYDNYTQAFYENDGAKVSVIYDGNTYEVLLIEIDGEEVSSMPIKDMSKRQLVSFLNKI